jgi:hypothetical protein
LDGKLSAQRTSQSSAMHTAQPLCCVLLESNDHTVFSNWNFREENGQKYFALIVIVHFQSPQVAGANLGCLAERQVQFFFSYCLAVVSK